MKERHKTRFDVAQSQPTPWS